MRGFLFEIANDTKNAGNMTADSFACTRDGGSFAEWYEDMDKDAVLARMELTAEKYGIEHGLEDGMPYVAFSQESKNSWFAGRYKKFMEKAKAMTLDVFASNKANLCKMEFEDTYGDAVYLAEEEYAMTLDGFIRQAEPGERYYIGNIIGMH